MEEYSDLRFDGDLSFLNDNLDAAKNAMNNPKIEEVKKDSVYKLQVPAQPKQNERVQMEQNVRANPPVQNMKNEHSNLNSENLHFDQNTQFGQMRQNGQNPGFGQNLHNGPKAQGPQFGQMGQNAYDPGLGQHFQNGQNAQNMNYGQMGQNLPNGQNLHNGQNAQYGQNTQFGQNMQFGQNAQFNQPVDYTQKLDGPILNQNSYQSKLIENNATVKPYQGKIVVDSETEYGEKKSQLEMMVLNSGYDLEMFNTLKMELIELEKEKIIMKYKQDLMMMILKS